MIIRQLAHLCFFTHQLDVMVAFYRDKMGFPIAFTMRNDDGFQFGYYFDLGNTTFVEIFDQAGAVKLWGGEAVPRTPNNGVRSEEHTSELQSPKIGRASCRERVSKQV